MTARDRTQVDLERELRPEFAPYLAIMDFLGALLGPRAEIVLHDTSDLSRSVVALTHGHLSGRSVGAPATDLVLRVLRNHEQDDEPYLANYLAQSAAGGRFRSSTFFIRDASLTVIGMLCINIDDTDLVLARDALAALTSTVEVSKGAKAGDEAPADSSPVPPFAERLSVTVDDLTLESVARIVATGTIPPMRMTQTEKMATVRELDRAGVFLLKGSVARVAAVLRISEPTVYRYLRQVRQDA